MSAFNDKVIREFRASNGHADSAGFGSNLVLLRSIGAHSGSRTGQSRDVATRRSGWLVVASAKGAARRPGWAYNLRAHRDVVIEAHVEGWGKSVKVTATELYGAEREAAFARFVELAPSFAAYQ